MENLREGLIESFGLAARRQQDFDDLQNEIAGRETGRVARFLPEGARGQDAAEKRKAERTEMLTRLQMMMRDPVYAALYNDTMDKLSEAETATEIALTKALERQRIADEALADIRDRALKLEDGRRVYRDESGTFRTEDGLAVSDDDMGSIAEQWNPGMPGFGDYVARNDAAGEAAASVDGIRIYQTDVLGATRDRMEDQDDVPSKEELDAARRNIEAHMPPEVRAEMPSAVNIEIAARPDVSPPKPAL